MALVFVPALGRWIGKPGAQDRAATGSLALDRAGRPFGDVPARFAGSTFSVLRLRAPASRQRCWPAPCTMLIGVQYDLRRWLGNGVQFFPEVEPEHGKVYPGPRPGQSFDLASRPRWCAKSRREVLATWMSLRQSVYTRRRRKARRWRWCGTIAEDVIGVDHCVELTDWRELRAPAVRRPWT